LFVCILIITRYLTKNKISFSF